MNTNDRLIFKNAKQCQSIKKKHSRHKNFRHKKLKTEKNLGFTDLFSKGKNT